MRKELKFQIATSYVTEVTKHSSSITKEEFLIPERRKLLHGYHPERGFKKFGKEFQNEYFILIPISEKEIEENAK